MLRPEHAAGVPVHDPGIRHPAPPVASHCCGAGHATERDPPQESVSTTPLRSALQVEVRELSPQSPPEQTFIRGSTQSLLVVQRREHHVRVVSAP